MPALSGLRDSCPKLRASAMSARELRFAAALYLEDICARISAKKVSGGGSPIARRCAFVAHLVNAENIAAGIGLVASIAINYAPISANCQHGTYRGSARFDCRAVSALVRTVGC